MAMTRWLLTLLLLLPVAAWGQTSSSGVKKTGTTVAGQLPFFSNTTTVTTDTALTWNNTLKTLSLGTGTSVTIAAATLTAARTFTLPDANSNPVIPKDCNALVTGEVVKSISALGVLGCMAPTMTVRGATSGVISVLAQAAGGTYNFNLPTTAGTAGQSLLSGGGGSAPMTWGAGSGGGGCGTTGTIGQIMVFTGTSTCAGASDFTWDGSIFAVGNGLYQGFVSATLTTNRTVNLPDADSTTVVAKDCNALVPGQTVKSVSAAGVVGCMATPLVKNQIAIAAGDTIASTASATNFATTYTVAANGVTAGSLVRIRARGTHATTGTPTLIFTVKAGAVTLCTSVAMTTGSGVSGKMWRAECDVAVVTAGASGTVEAQGLAHLATSTTATTVSEMVSAAVITVNTTTTNVLAAGITWSASDAANTITMRQFTVEILN